MDLTIKNTLRNKEVQFYEIWGSRYLGQLHYENRPHGIYVHLTLIPEYHRKGIGRHFFKETINKARKRFGNRAVIALIKEGNNKSINFFKSLNFEYSGKGNGLVRYKLR